MAVNQTSSLLKLNQLAKDLNMKTKDVCTVLEEKGIEAKSQKTLEVKEFETLFEALTKKNQINNILDYLDGITYIPSKKTSEAAEKPVSFIQTVTDAVKENPEIIIAPTSLLTLGSLAGFLFTKKQRKSVLDSEDEQLEEDGE